MSIPAHTPPTLVHQILDRLRAGETLTERQAEDAFERILTGQMDEAQIGAFLAMIGARPATPTHGAGPTIDELVGGTKVMRRYVTPVPLPTSPPGTPAPTLIDTCGTGGAPKLFNVSTIVAFIVAAARPSSGPRVIVAKHGSTSRTGRGSAEVLKALGVNIAATPDVQSRCLASLGLCFCFSVHHHPAMKFAAAARKSLHFPTIFNLLGPLTNPAGASRQLIGTFSEPLALKIAHTLARLSGSTPSAPETTERAMVVHSHDGLDELSTTDTNIIHQIRAGEVHTRILDPRSLGLKRATIEQLQADSLNAATTLVRDVLSGTPSAAADMALLNAAGALIVADAAADFPTGLGLARDALHSGRAQRVLDGLIAETNQPS